MGEADVLFQGKLYQTPLYDREKLRHGHRVPGPAVVCQMDSTILIPLKWMGVVDSFHNMVITRA